MATLEWCNYTVQEDGRVRGAGEFLYGDDLLDNSQDPLLLHKNKRVWVGTNPLDRSQPAIVWDPVTDAVMCWEVHEAVKGKFNDKASAEASSKRRTHARKLTRKIADLQHDEARANLRASLALIKDAPAPEPGQWFARIFMHLSGGQPSPPWRTVLQAPQPHHRGSWKTPHSTQLCSNFMKGFVAWQRGLIRNWREERLRRPSRLSLRIR